MVYVTNYVYHPWMLSVRCNKFKSFDVSVLKVQYDGTRHIFGDMKRDTGRWIGKVIYYVGRLFMSIF